MLIIQDVTDTFRKEVLVQFDQPNGTVKQGSFTAEYLRIPQAEIDELMDDESLSNSALCERVLRGASDIGRTPTELLSPEEALAFVMKTPECVNAAAHVFFRSTRPERYNEKTSRMQRKRG